MTHRWACLLGQPVAHSLSPRLHNAAFAAVGMDAHYEARLVAPEALPAAVAALRVADCLGANATAPHKAAIVPCMDDLGPEVRLLGVANTIVNRDGRLIGRNTDAAGLARWMRLAGMFPVAGPALVLGAGGVARSAVWALADLGARSITVLNRTPPRAEEVVHQFGPQLPNVRLQWGPLEAVAEPAPAPYAVVINATSMGHDGAAPAVHPSCYSRDSLAIELAYNPPETAFMVAAQAAGARAENGLGMLVHQAALAFEYWTGQPAPMHAYQTAVGGAVSP